MDTPQTPITCPSCGTILGYQVAHKGKLFMDDGEMMVVEGHKHCRVCGRVFYWKSSVVRVKPEARVAGAW